MGILGLFGKKKVDPPRKSAPAPKRAAVKHTPQKVRPKQKPTIKKPSKPAPKPVKTASGKSAPKQQKPSSKSISIPAPVINKMPDQQAFELVKKSSLPLAPFAFVKSEKELPQVLKKIGFPCVMKITGKTIAHKTELGGVKTNLQNELTAITSFKELQKIKGCEKVLVQKHLSGVELIIGGKSDPSFGYIVSVGLGGAYAEILKDVTFRVAPITVVDAEAMVKELKGFEFLNGGRGQKPVNFAALYDLLAKVSRFVVANKFKELDLNPVFCSSDGCWIADVRVVR